jgi:hypothetical protein
MKKILYIFLTISFLSFTVIPAYIYAEYTVTSAEEEENLNRLFLFYGRNNTYRFFE